MSAGEAHRSTDKNLSTLCHSGRSEINRQREAATSAATVGPLSGLSILVVDDHSDSLKRIGEILQAAGAIAIGVRTANVAIGFAMLARFDAVIVDLTMEDGARFLQQLREAPTFSIATPVFAVSGERHDQPGAATEFAGYFLKPVNLDVLVDTLAPLRCQR
jgi:CheY-like chemotaxis protein